MGRVTSGRPQRPPTPPRRRAVDAARAAVERPRRPGAAPGPRDPLIGDLRRAGLLPLLVLHFAAAEPAYGNQLIERIATLTGGRADASTRTRCTRCCARSRRAGWSRASGSTPSAGRGASTAITAAGRDGARAPGAASSARGWTASPRSIDAIRGGARRLMGRAPGVDLRRRAGAGRGRGALVRPAPLAGVGRRLRPRRHARGRRGRSAGARAGVGLAAGRPRPRASSASSPRGRARGRRVEVEDERAHAAARRSPSRRGPRRASRSRSTLEYGLKDAHAAHPASSTCCSCGGP